MDDQNNIHILETITRYIEPEMHVLISGNRFSYLPFPLLLNSAFTGLVTTVDNQSSYYTETFVDPGWKIHCTERSEFVYPITETSDFAVLSDVFEDNLHLMDQFTRLETVLKPGGFMFLRSSVTQYEEVCRMVGNADFEFIEKYKDGTTCCYLLKKGWNALD